MLKDRKKPTEHRQGNIIKLADFIQRFAEMRHEKDFYDDECNITDKYQCKLDGMMKEIHLFDISEIGNLYLTSGGRVVLDKGWGEYFTKGDKKIFSLKELTSGMKYDEFIRRINEVKKPEEK